MWKKKFSELYSNEEEVVKEEHWLVGWRLWGDVEHRWLSGFDEGVRFYDEEKAIKKLHQLQNNPKVGKVFAIHVEPYFYCDKRGK